MRDCSHSSRSALGMSVSGWAFWPYREGSTYQPPGITSPSTMLTRCSTTLAVEGCEGQEDRHSPGGDDGRKVCFGKERGPGSAATVGVGLFQVGGQSDDGFDRGIGGVHIVLPGRRPTARLGGGCVRRVSRPSILRIAGALGNGRAVRVGCARRKLMASADRRDL
jgi:hypothetical protein